MYILIETSPDGDRYKISNNLPKIQEKFEEEKYEGNTEGSLYLVEVEEETEFGFGAYGDLFGGKVLMEHHFEEEEE